MQFVGEQQGLSITQRPLWRCHDALPTEAGRRLGIITSLGVVRIDALDLMSAKRKGRRTAWSREAVSLWLSVMALRCSSSSCIYMPDEARRLTEVCRAIPPSVHVVNLIMSIGSD